MLPASLTKPRMCTCTRTVTVYAESSDAVTTDQLKSNNIKLEPKSCWFEAVFDGKWSKAAKTENILKVCFCLAAKKSPKAKDVGHRELSENTGLC